MKNIVVTYYPKYKALGEEVCQHISKTYKIKTQCHNIKDIREQQKPVDLIISVGGEAWISADDALLSLPPRRPPTR